ncbi:hypothetical protein EV421DRAFT_140132 [Armillaria borealis]|uniref:F-box domain-containing protein n=1 Tax=Armillaria borealis TaxID=47425 RepID=A0AA39IXW1_9AGAR|nr:hypothetical protein EV421DRAFT_140132 [Armillaria borealis]
MDAFPQELIEAIIDELSDDREALKACSLVSQSFFPRSQKLLFSSVVLDSRDDSSRVHNPSVDFLKLLARSTRIAPLVRNFTVYNFTWGKNSWFTQDQNVVPRILGSLANLRKMTISGRHYDRRWDGSSDIRTSLCQSFSLPHLKSLSLNYTSFLRPSDFLQLFSNSRDLKELRLMNVYISDQLSLQAHPDREHNTPIDDERLAQRPKLRYLRIQNVPVVLIDTLTHPHSPLDLGSLRRLQVWSDHGDQSDHLQRLLEAAGDALDEVVFHGFSSSTNGLDISHVPNITCYFSNFFSDRVANHTVLSGLTELFFQRYSRDTSRMETVTFNLRSHPKAIIDCPRDEWRRLEEAMMVVKRKVRFEIPVRDMKRSMKDPLERECLAAVRRGMGMLSDRGILEVDMVQGP